MSSSQKLEDVPELMQHIQLQLPPNEAARTSVLSKSWLHAWSTIPTLRFCVQGRGRNGMKVVDMDRILTRYLRDNIPIESFNLNIDMDQGSASLVEKCLRTIATKTCTLKELSFSFHLYDGISFKNLPHEILSCENLTKMRVLSGYRAMPPSIRMTSHHLAIIKCVSLQELYLNHVNISQEILDGILSSCRLLTKIDLIKSSQSLNTIKVKNLPCLYELRIVTEVGSSTALEINHVPNLRVFKWVFKGERSSHVPFNAYSISLGSNLKQLRLGNMVTYDGSLDMIISGAPFLERLTLEMTYWVPGSFHFTCASIKSLSLLKCSPKLIDVEVYAPNLVFFRLDSNTMPSLLFPVSTLIKQTKFRLDLKVPVDASFFLKMREALALSSNCDLHITTLYHGLPPFDDIDIDDLRTRLLLPPAMNVQQMSFETLDDQCMWERCPFFDAFFEICHPNHVTAIGSKNHFCKVMITDVLEKKTTTACWTRYLKHVQISRHTKWETLTNSHKSFLETLSPVHYDFRLEWH